eukprot:2944164-Rhodomonas_salina.2
MEAPPRGTDACVLSSLPTSTFKSAESKESDHTQCCICHDEWSSGCGRLLCEASAGSCMSDLVCGTQDGVRGWRQDRRAPLPPSVPPRVRDAMAGAVDQVPHLQARRRDQHFGRTRRRTPRTRRVKCSLHILWRCRVARTARRAWQPKRALSRRFGPLETLRRFQLAAE